MPAMDTEHGHRQPAESDLRQCGRGGIGGRLAGETGSLPNLTDAVMGRAGEVGALDQLLADPDVRLLTLTGPPGVGKTRLAIATAAVAAPRFPDGVAFVDLTEIRDPNLVPAAVLGAVDCKATASSSVAHHIVRALTGKKMLLLIDNFEHVLDAGPTVAAFLAVSPGLKLLLTSRERLHLRAEREIPVRPLALPSTGDESGRLPPAPALWLAGQSGASRANHPLSYLTPAAPRRPTARAAGAAAQARAGCAWGTVCRLPAGTDGLGRPTCASADPVRPRSATDSRRSRLGGARRCRPGDHATTGQHARRSLYRGTCAYCLPGAVLAATEHPASLAGSVGPEAHAGSRPAGARQVRRLPPTSAPSGWHPIAIATRSVQAMLSAMRRAPP